MTNFKFRNHLDIALRGGVAGASLAVALAAAAVAAPAFAQDVSSVPVASEEDPVSEADIVVTGTLIRGQAPTGSDITTVTADDIAQLGIAETSQLLGSLPSDSNFNSRPQVGSFGQFQTVNAPVLRFLGGGASGSNSTLLLLNGHRLPGMGVTQTSADIDAIPPGALQRVDLVPDGGSATYGADAVGGVVNLITRKRYDGLEVGGHYGQADDYTQWDVSATGGKTWDNGSLWATYNYAHHDIIRNSDRDFVQNLDYTTTPPTGNSLNCSPGNYQAGGLVFTNTPPFFAFLPITNYPIVNGVPVAGPANKCDITRGTTFFPAASRHSAMAGLNVDLSDAITFDVTAFYTNRKSTNDAGPTTYNLAATYPGLPSGTAYGDLSPTFGPNNYGRTALETWGVTPQITAKLGGDWQAVAFYNYGEGYSSFSSAAIDQSALQAQANSGAFNPFTGLFATTAAGQAALAYQSNFRSLSTGRDEISNGRVVVDGPLFALPGGDVRVAVGGEILREQFSQRNGSALNTNLGSILTYTDARTVKSAFGELSVPLFSEDNSAPGFHSLILSAAGRYDHYSDFGGTSNPKFGITWKPTSWWTLRGNWGKSYQAPSLASKAETIPTALQVFPANTFGAPGDTAGKFILLLYPGGGINLKPQKATTWQIGTDFKPEFVPGLSASLTYYNIDFKDRISFPSFFNPSFYSLYPDSYILNTAANPLTAAQIQDYVSSVSPTLLAAANLDTYLADPSKVYALENGLSQNLARAKTSGLDFSVDYQRPTAFGSVFAGVAGTYILTYKSQSTPTSTFQGLDANQVIRWRTSATLGGTAGDFLGKVTWNRTGGFEVPPRAANLNQSSIGDFNIFNLAFQYTPKVGGLLEDLSFTLNVDNVFDQDPPQFNGSNGSGAGYFGFTLGRYVQLGISKKF
ncbi:TonB-dependent receptor domain-containing protein [Sphingobium boeckii]|uniref:Iron complex outermembrane receptor protein n=1 Tax=Sphingobium boeckii TaxID=1082345 RepID=A0A7W9AHV7_9SPHN|nr:TonB-dependent receptor [Sphingobium boeckii]MBB5685934.1 iron complex outermembrane receptor protein [Sphingobium boeckii]